jgi:Ca2+-binding RTX toxin-like protein
VDTLHGGTGADLLYGGTGGDSVTPGPGADQVHLGAGNDEVILRSDGSVDEVWCGRGYDSIVWLNSEPDPLDVFHGCEETLRVFMSP